ncbi:MAG: hypothetical protein LBJ43_03970 [Propionibacteriaceae bacterium]|nr:hypothetical protein [Propionibacteriaceae bacterium]
MLRKTGSATSVGVVLLVFSRVSAFGVCDVVVGVLVLLVRQRLGYETL